jgi:hypothetical protein
MPTLTESKVVEPSARASSRARRPRSTRCPPGDLHSGDDTADAVDAAPGDGVCATGRATCTLRGAIMDANALPGADDIGRPAGTYPLTIRGRSRAPVPRGTST